MQKEIVSLGDQSNDTISFNKMRGKNEKYTTLARIITDSY